MVRIITKPCETPRQTYKAALVLACKLFDVSIKSPESKQRNDIRIKVGHLMEHKVIGRTFPMKKNRGTSVSARNRPVPFDNPLRYCYPRNLVTNKDKEKYLNKSLERGEMSEEIFEDLFSVL